VLTHTASTTGTYRVQVVADSGSGGYALHVEGDSVGPNLIEVVQSVPNGGQILFGLPEVITVEFSHAVDPQTVAASDLKVGESTALSVTQLSPTRFAFTIGPDADTGDGEYSVQLDANSVSNLAGVGVEAYTTSFNVDRSSADFDSDGDVDVADLNAFCRSHSQVPQTYDINQDGRFDYKDYAQILNDIFGASPGDITLDGTFDSEDLVRLFDVAKYETGATDAVWTDGDFNCDGTVSTGDLVLAFMTGEYAVPAAAVPNFAGALGDRPSLPIDGNVGLATFNRTLSRRSLRRS
jgi:hypothetical protein